MHCRARTSRALVDLMSKRFGIRERRNSNDICVDGLRELSIQNHSTIIFIAAVYKNIYFWVMEEGRIRFKLHKLESREESLTDLLNLPRRQELHDDPVVECEDRSLSAYYRMKSSLNENKGESQKRLEEEEGGQRKEKSAKDESSRHLLYNRFFAPIADLIQCQDITIVPEGDMFLVPFSALQDADSKFLSETLRIRLIPSLTALKLIQASPNADHSNTGVLIVGDPAVHPTTKLQPLPGARKEGTGNC
ncbi:hypothetical protein OS493_022985 [Desmophyllum pertusum]|uniref:CHAT domain-containing protein n=1 Tax=Desmophyllum pertusum TaxID=174260 RepID=A0A9W9ZB30_9CNID|nr:hypothetical protein OS493_022985 [Desmophyllum pertusum]